MEESVPLKETNSRSFHVGCFLTHSSDIRLVLNSPELRSYRVVTAVMNWQQKRGLALWMFCRVDTEPGTMLQ